LRRRWPLPCRDRKVWQNDSGLPQRGFTTG
jgi:hypothetical protein